MINNVPEGLDGVNKLSYEQTSGIFNFIQRNYAFITDSTFATIRFKLY